MNRNENDKTQLLTNLDKLHTTEMGIDRIKRNLNLDVADVAAWCRQKVEAPDNEVIRKGKNWYVYWEGCEITVNAYSYTIITAHKVKDSFRRIQQRDD